MELTLITILSIIAFLAVTLLLVAVLLYAKAKLTPSGKVLLTINDEREIEVSPGYYLHSQTTRFSFQAPVEAAVPAECANVV